MNDAGPNGFQDRALEQVGREERDVSFPLLDYLIAVKLGNEAVLQDAPECVDQIFHTDLFAFFP